MRKYFSQNMLVMIMLGFASGLPLALTGSTLSIWLAESEITLSKIGLFALVGISYSFKFAWAFVLDRYQIPAIYKFGRRKSWILSMQILLITAIIVMSWQDPAGNIVILGIIASIIAFFSATQDIAIDAYRIELLAEDEQVTGIAVFTFGYRLGMLVSGAGALFIADFYDWMSAYMVMAAAMLIGVAAIFISKKEAELSESITKPKILDAFKDFLQKDGWWIILIFVILYKLGDAFAGVMTNTFLVKIGFDKSEIATIVKTFGFVATILGGFAGAMIANKYPLKNSLLIAGILQMLSNLIFIAQYYAGHDNMMLMATISVENFTSGMGGAIFVAYISKLCNLSFTATQYALLSSFATFGRTTLSSSAGAFAESLGWPIFFILSAIIALPGIILLLKMKKF